MDEAGRKAARRRAIISFVAAGVLVVVSVVGLIGVDRRHDRWDRTADRIEHRMGSNGRGEWNGTGEFGRRSNDDEDGPRAGGGGDSRPAMPGNPGRGPETGGPGRGGPSRDDDRDGADDGPDGSTTTSTTTTTAPGAGI